MDEVHLDKVLWFIFCPKILLVQFVSIIKDKKWNIRFLFEVKSKTFRLLLVAEVVLMPPAAAFSRYLFSNFKVGGAANSVSVCGCSPKKQWQKNITSVSVGPDLTRQANWLVNQQEIRSFRQNGFILKWCISILVKAEAFSVGIMLRQCAARL